MKKVLYKINDYNYYGTCDIEKMDRNILVTHNDLDGAGCAIVALLAGVHEIYYCGNGKDIDDTVAQLLDEYNPRLYKNFTIVIADNSISDTVAERINELQENDHNFKCTMYDHHESAKSLGRYSWVSINTNECGTTMVLDHYGCLMPDKLGGKWKDVKPVLESFCESARNRDLWLWEVNDDQNANIYNEILYMTNDIGEYVAQTANNILDGYVADNSIINTAKIEIEKKNKYIANNILKYAKSVITVRDGNSHKRTNKCNERTIQYTVAFTFASKYTSEMGNAICKSNDEIDICAIIAPARGEYGAIELRTIKDDIDLSVIAKRFGGGGHRKAAGFPMPKNMQSRMIDAISKCISF